jgi:hypothetical protein
MRLVKLLSRDERRCTKKGYETYPEVQEAIRAIAKKYPYVVYKKAYRCAKCKAWHITSTPPSRGRRIQR